MTIDFSFLPKPSPQADTAIVPIYPDLELTPQAQEINKRAGGLVAQALKRNKNFKGKNGETMVISLPDAAEFAHIVLLGLGETDELTILKAQDAGGKLYKTLQALKSTHASLILKKRDTDVSIGMESLAAQIATGLHLRSYEFEKYKTKDEDAVKLGTFEVVIENHAGAKDIFERNAKETDGVFLARNLVNEPPNHLYPESFADIIARELKPLGVEVEILDDKKMHKMGMGAILGVGMGSIRLPRIVIMRWNVKKLKKGDKGPVALVGKGVTFDTGGISIKPSAGMEEMKMDMGGAAAVVGAMKAIALRKSKASVIGAVGLAENMPSDRSYRPSDILTSHSGKTIEVLNTDAEGRLVLADVLSYVQDTYAPHTIVDLATLTGAMMVALGQEYAGTFANDDDLWRGLESASAATGEKLWRLPLDPAWKKDVEGTFGDVQNVAKMGRLAGGCTAAGFLEHFIKKDVKWAHIDIAGTAWIKGDKPTVPRHGTGFGVRMLSHFVAGYE